MQNKANVKMGNINISTARTKAYAKEQRTMSNERYPKQSQIKANFKRSSVVRKIAPYRTTGLWDLRLSDNDLVGQAPPYILSGFVPVSQLCKTKPIYSRPK